MNNFQHTLLKLAEECNEVAQVASKTMQFGYDSVNPNTLQSNKEALKSELSDLFAMVKMLNDEYDLGFNNNSEAITAKHDKVKHYRELSKKMGFVNE